jgi:hypothetical protein
LPYFLKIVVDLALSYGKVAPMTNTIDAKTLFPDTSRFYGYQPIIDALGTAVVQVDDDDYQGDTRVIFKKGKEYGYLKFGWGSCSGCDALQACDSIEEVQKLVDELQEQVKWFDSLEELQKFFRTHDWEGDFGFGDEQVRFIDQVKALT